MDAKDLARWAARHGGIRRAPESEQAPPAQAPPAPVAAASVVAVPAAYRQPQGVRESYPQPSAGQPPNQPHGTATPYDPKGTCHLVKPGTKDPYAELLATVPDLNVGDAGRGYDAMAGKISPLSMAELQAVMPSIQAESGQMVLANDADASAYPTSGRGAVQPIAHAPALKQVG